MPSNQDLFASSPTCAAVAGGGVSSAATADCYLLRDGIYVPPAPVAHREEEFASEGFEQLNRMQERHFWYVGRHRFVLYAVARQLLRSRTPHIPRRIADLGGGCGGWLAYLLARWKFPIRELALADSSLTALEFARQCLPLNVRRYQIDLLALEWQNRWDLIFLLDVLEHIPDQRKALREIHAALSPGGLLFLTAPALQVFWTWNDAACGHVRRYSRRDLKRLAAACGYRCLEARYFLFFLSPLLFASRLATSFRAQRLSKEALGQLAATMHAIPNRVMNALLSAVFCCETPLGHYLAFPWGTSILAVFQKPP